MKCYYEILNVPRDADDTMIKTAYKKMALKWHPDKNLDSPEEAKQQFQLVQQAYDVLSDRQERAWYDNHREQILFASNRDYEDKSVDLFQYFTTSCFKGYGDDDSGFYTIYRNVFEQVASEDMEFIGDKEEFCEIPTFGNSQSDYETVVGPFYAYWSNYSTKKTFLWLDPHNITEVRGGKILKLMEKKNKKVRLKAKKERNEEVRSLVAFVRKRDKRVQVQTKLEENKKLENRKKHEQIGMQKRRERQMQLNNSGQAEWAKFDNVKSELEEIERHLAKEFGDELTDSDEEELLNDNLYCIACNKLFKNPKAFQSHEISKKHRDRVAKIKQELLDDDSFVSSGMSDNENEELSEESHDGDHCELIKDEQFEACLNSENPNDITSCEASTTIREKPKKKKINQKNNISDPSANEASQEILLVTQDSDTEFSSSSKQKKKDSKKKKSKHNHSILSKTDPIEDSSSQVTNDMKNSGEPNNQNLSEETENNETSSQTPNEPGEKQKKVPKKKNNQATVTGKAEIKNIDTDHYCAACKANFPSKNKLFDHLKKTGHSIYLPKDSAKCKNKKNKNKDK